MKISVVCVGRIKEKFFSDAIAEYSKRLSRYCTLEIIEVQDEKTPDGAGEALEQKIKDLGNKGVGHIGFVIGGSLGLSDEVLEKCDMHLSFSDMTFPHQLMRVILLEQVYRSFRILNNEPYHK